jgi:hypothetical protein
MACFYNSFKNYRFQQAKFSKSIEVMENDMKTDAVLIQLKIPCLPQTSNSMFVTSYLDTVNCSIILNSYYTHVANYV